LLNILTGSDYDSSKEIHYIIAIFTYINNMLYVRSNATREIRDLDQNFRKCRSTFRNSNNLGSYAHCTFLIIRILLQLGGLCAAANKRPSQQQAEAGHGRIGWHAEAEAAGAREPHAEQSVGRKCHFDIGPKVENSDAAAAADCRQGCKAKATTRVHLPQQIGGL
jgi:hypothetical protein